MNMIFVDCSTKETMLPTEQTTCPKDSCFNTTNVIMIILAILILFVAVLNLLGKYYWTRCGTTTFPKLIKKLKLNKLIFIVKETTSE